MSLDTAPELLGHFCRAGRNRAPGILVDAVLDGTAPEEDLPILVAYAWTMAEYPTRCEEPLVWECLFRRVGYRNAAGESITRPDRPITLWRGASKQEGTTGAYGMSWTTDRDKARWFADRHDQPGMCVYRAEVPPAALLADYRDDDRDESELVVNPAMIPHAQIEEN